MPSRSRPPTARPRPARRVAITGATGFIGGALARRLREQGLEVLATGRNRRIGQALRTGGIDFRPADLQNAGELITALAPADCVIHCAGQAGDWGEAELFRRVNVAGTRHLIRACHHHGIRKVIFFSTPSVYFNGEDRRRIREDELLPRRPATTYAATKLTAERELLAASGAGLRSIILRPRAVFGCGDRTFLPRVMRMARRGRLPVVGGGDALTDVTYIENLADAAQACLAAPDDAWNEVYNLSNEDPISVAEWFDRLLAIAGLHARRCTMPVWLAGAIASASELAARLPGGPKHPLMTRFAVGYLARTMTLSIEKARRRLDYRPRYDTQASFEHYARQLRRDRT